METKKTNGMYEVLNPWADAEPIPLKGLAPRVTDLAGKRIGLFCNSKRVARPTLAVLEEKLKARFATSQISWYFFSKVNVPEVETENKAKFEEWLKGVDAVVLSYGD